MSMEETAMAMEDTAVEAVVGGQVQIPDDFYVGTNVVRQHIAEFFYRARQRKLLSEGETPLAMFDCIILERDGRRLGGLTLHDYAVLTDQHLITWGRGVNKDVVDKFPWKDLALDRFGRRNLFEGVVKFNYLLKPVGSKRRINLRGHDDKIAPASNTPGERGTALYLDLMPAGEVRVCAEMIQYFLSRTNGATGAENFKEHFRMDLARSYERLSRVNFLTRPFYVDMGNGMLVEAGAIAERPRMEAAYAANRGSVSPASPYRNQPAEPRMPSARVTASERVQPARVARVATPGEAIQPANTGGRPITAPEKTTPTGGGVSYSMTGDVPSVGMGGNILNSGNRATDTIRGTNRNNDTRRGPSSGQGQAIPKEISTGATVSLNSNPYSGPSKLEAYDRRVTGRPSGATESRLSQAPAPAPRPIRAERPAPLPRPVRAERVAPARSTPVSRQPMASVGSNPSPMPSATYVSPPTLPIAKRPGADNRVFNEMSNAEAEALGRPLVMPIGVALPRAFLNVYSISRLARGIWIDPRNLGRNLSDVSQTVGALGEIVEVVTNDEGARATAFNRLRRTANTTLGDNIIFHYTVWPFVKPVLDALNLPSGRGGGIGPARRRVSVRRFEDELDQMSNDPTVTGDEKLPFMGAVAAQERTDPPPAANGGRLKINGNDKPATATGVYEVPVQAAPTPPATPTPASPPPPSASATKVAVTETTGAESVPVESSPGDAPLNTTSKGSFDPTQGMNSAADTSGDKPAHKSKLGDLES